MTTTEVADQLDLGRRSTYERLERLVDHDRLETKKVGGNGRVWWQPSVNRRASTKGLDVQDDLFEELVDATEEYAIFMLDPEGRVQTWNPGAERIKGYTADEIVDEHFSTFYTEADRSAGVPEDNLTKAARHGSSEDEGWRVRADGSEFWATVTISTIRDDDGEIEGYAKVTRDTTDRREYERRLEEQADRLRRQRNELESELDEVFDRISDSFYALDEDLRFRYLNDHAADFLGLDESAIGSDIRDQNLTETFESALYEALETQEAVTLEDYYPPWDRWFHNTIYPSESGLSVYSRDVTERKRRERELARYETIVETSPIGITIVGGDGNMQFANDRAEEIFGRSKSRINALSFDDPEWDEVDEDGELLSREELPFPRIVESGEPVFDQVSGVLRPDGERVWISVNGAPVYDDCGEIDSVVFSIEDITGRKEQQRALEESKRRFQQIAEHIDEVVWLRPADSFDPLYVNPAFEEVWGHNPDLFFDGPGRFLETVHPDDRERVQEAFDDQLDGEYDETYRVVHPDGEVRWVRDRAFPIENDDGDVYRIVGIADDITARKEYEQQLEESNERLEQFAYTASHDLQEPLRMVTSYLQLIENRYGDALDGDGEEFLEFAIDGAERMREMIDALLEYSRIETRGDPFEPVDLTDVLGDVRKDLQMQIEERNAEITTDDLPRVDGDYSQLRQVFQNLLSNAIEYSGDEPSQIDISGRRDDGQWIISVEDNGIGIDHDEQERIFEVFQRLHTQEEHSGTGIGLALSQRIVERHGGEIWVDSEPGEGATFSFTLPAVDT